MADDPTVPRPAKKPLLPRWLKFLLMLLGLLLAVAALLWVIADISTRDALEAEIAELRAQGWPVTLEDLQPHEVPPEENAALVYQQALMRAAFFDEQCWEIVIRIDAPERHGLVRADDWSYLEAHLKKNEKALGLVRQAAGMPRCRFPFAAHGAHVDEVLTGTRGIVHVLSQAAIPLAVEKGQTEKAVTYWLDGVALARGLEHQDWFIGDLFRVSCVELLVKSLRRLLLKGLLDQEQLERVLGALEGLEGRASLAASLRAQAPYVRYRFGSYAESLAQRVVPWRGVDGQRSSRDRAIDVRNWFWGTWLLRPVRQHEERLALEFLADVVPLAEKPWYQVETQIRQLQEKAEQLPFYALLTDPGRHYGFPFTLETQGSHDTRVVCARTAVALELHRIRYGRYPEGLDELVPDILAETPIDPFDGQPLRYVNSSERVLVYGVGVDLQDNGGSEEWGEGQPKDTIFAVRRGSTGAEEADDE